MDPTPLTDLEHLPKCVIYYEKSSIYFPTFAAALASVTVPAGYTVEAFEFSTQLPKPLTRWFIQLRRVQS